MCQAKNITCYFVNSFTILVKQNNLLVPDHAWILPIDQCLANSLVKLLDSVRHGPALRDEEKFLVQDWLEHRELLKKYFLPNDNYPNRLGNEKIAEFLSEKLKLKLNDTR